MPRLVNISGVFHPADGQPPAPVEVVTLSVYAEPEGGVPLWQEMQSVTVEATGRFTVLLGASHPDGLPPVVFASGEARWMSLLFARPGEVERPRVRITSVPYALKASDAETLGGRPASAYLLAPTAGDQARRAAGASPDASLVAPPESPVITDLVLPGTTNFLAKYVNSADVGNSAVFESGGTVGIGTTTPLDILHLRYNNTNGALTGLGRAEPWQHGYVVLGHALLRPVRGVGTVPRVQQRHARYRINNIATNPSINFMLGGASRLKVDTTVGTTISGPASVFAGAATIGLFVENTSADPSGTAVSGLDNAGIGIFGTYGQRNCGRRHPIRSRRRLGWVFRR